jgi:XTP/dITP diphosphohydrolase
MAARARLVAATRNPAKLVEMRRLLAHLGCEIVGLDRFPGFAPPPETGASYIENARIKARAAFELTHEACFADDSGLEVDALGGEPGVLSARYDGPAGTPESRNAKLLARLEGVAGQMRTARFRAVVVLVEPGARGPAEHAFEGVLEGRIATAPSGSGGFGYDPVFVVPSEGVTVASLPPGRKDELSHRGQALRAMAAHIALGGGCGS